MKAGSRAATMEEVLSQMDERIRRLEQSKVLVVGPWRITADATGRLIATHAHTNQVVPLAFLPASGSS